MVPVSTAQALEVLKAIQAKVYKRNDLPGDSTRIGFIAQDFEAALPPEWTNIVGHTEAADEYVDEQGTRVLAKASTLTLDYSRTACILWECTRSLTARVEALEARLP